MILIKNAQGFLGPLPFEIFFDSVVNLRPLRSGCLIAAKVEAFPFI